MADLQALHKALQVFDSQNKNGSFGTAARVYVSLPDSSASCASWSLPSLPSGYQYVCATTATYRNVNGTGWIPVNFQSIPTGSPLPVLPIDPQNTSSIGVYYTYVMGGGWHLAASMESFSYKFGGSKELVTKDGGNATGLYEVGTNLSLIPIDYGDSSLVGNWRFDEGSGIFAADSSGRGNVGTLTNGPVWTIGRVGPYALSFDGSNDYVISNTSASLPVGSGARTMLAWIKPHSSSSTDWKDILYWGLNLANQLSNIGMPNGYFSFAGYGNDCGGVTLLALNTWTYVTAVYEGTLVKLYLNANLDKVCGIAALNTPSGTSIYIGTRHGYFNGIIDDVRIYNRALSVAEISAIYHMAQ